MCILERKLDSTHEEHNRLDDPLPFKIMYNNIVLILKPVLW